MQHTYTITISPEEHILLHELVGRDTPLKEADLEDGEVDSCYRFDCLGLAEAHFSEAEGVAFTATDEAITYCRENPR